MNHLSIFFLNLNFDSSTVFYISYALPCTHLSQFSSTAVALSAQGENLKEGNIACRTWDEVRDVSITNCRLNSLGEQQMFNKILESKRCHKGDVQHQTAVAF